MHTKNLKDFDIIYPQCPAEYREIWELQKRLFNKKIEGKKKGTEENLNYIISVEHKPVLTLGRHGDINNLLLSEESLKKRGIECIPIERGGDITYHGPGQLVVYPIIDMADFHIGVGQEVEMVEACVIQTIKEYGIEGERIDGASGVWIGKDTENERKICALGVKCSRFVTMHGLALNVNTDLSAFSLINPCGFKDKGVTSIAKEIGKNVDIKEVGEKLLNHLLQLLAQARV